MRAVVQVEEIRGRQCLVVTEPPYQVSPDSLAAKIAELAQGRPAQRHRRHRGPDLRPDRPAARHHPQARRGRQVVLNNLYKHTQLQTTFGANMLALVDGCPDPADRRLHPALGQPPDRRHPAPHRVPAQAGRGAHPHPPRSAQGPRRARRGHRLIRRSRTVEDARDGLIALLEIDELQAQAILDMQLRRLAALERQKIIEQHDEQQAIIDDCRDILAKPDRQREIVSTELREIVDRYGDDRRTGSSSSRAICPWRTSSPRRTSS